MNSTFDLKKTVGQKIEDVIKRLNINQLSTLKPKYRILEPNSFYTTDFFPERVNLVVENGIVIEVWEG